MGDEGDGRVLGLTLYASWCHEGIKLVILFSMICIIFRNLGFGYVYSINCILDLSHFLTTHTLT